MRVRRILAGAAGVMGLAAGTIFGVSTSSAHVAVAKSAASSCAASIALEAPYATGPGIPLGLEQVHFAELAVAMANKANGTHITMGQDNTGLVPATAVSATNSVIASPAVAVVGPAGSNEVEAVGPLFGKAGMAFVSGSATLPALTTDGKNPTFFRVVPDDDVQGPRDANYIINHKLAGAKGSTILIVDDEEAYSEGLVSVMTPILKAAGYKINHQSYLGTDTGATLQSDLSSLASKVTSKTHIVVIPWQSPGNANQFGKTLQQQGKHVILFGTDGTNAPGTFEIPGSYSSNFGPDISQTKTALDESIVKGVAKYGAYGSFGVPTWQATTVVMDAVASVCKSGATPSRANVLAAIKKTNVPAADSPEGVAIQFAAKGNLKAQAGYLFKIEANGKYVEIPDK
jgi:branched-chain amino acid transport system substrate-binding protein